MIEHEPASLRVESLIDCCPFSFVISKGGRLVRLGRYFARHHPEIAGCRYDQAFILDSEPTSIEHLLSEEAPAIGLRERVGLRLRETDGLHLVGAFLPLAGPAGGLLFVGTISPKQIGEVADLGLTMSDFAPFDVSADFAMMAQVNEAVLKDTRLLNERLAAARDEAVGARRKIEAIALVDALSGLANRAAFQQVLDGAALEGGAGRCDGPCAMLLIDIDNFKPVNDNYGHAVGDQLIKSIGDRIRCAIDGEARAYRIGGDEFAVILRGRSSYQARIRAIEILREVHEPHRIQDKRIAVKVSAGLASRMRGVNDLHSLYRAADIALYEAKRSKDSTLQLFTSDMGRRELEKKLLERDLVEAIEKDQLEVFMQPQFDLQTGALWGAEALARWRSHRLERYIPPAVFIPMAEQCGLISRVDLFVFATVLRMQDTFGDKARGILWGSNLSPVSIGEESFQARLRGVVRTYGPPPAPTEIEITEGAILTETEAIGAALRYIRDMGIGVAIDDFGAGQTSLSHLTQIPVTRLKLDRSLVERVDKDERAEMVARSIVALAQELGLCVTAEGIERPSQAERLHRMGTMKVQGFLYGAPMPMAQFAALLEENVGGAAGNRRATG